MFKKHLSNQEFIWMAVIFWAASFTAMEAPFSFVFKTETKFWQVVVDLIISALFLADFVIHLKERKKAWAKSDIKATNKKTEYFLMAVDLFSSIPFDFLSYILGQHEVFQFLRFFRLVRIIKVVHMIQNITIVPTIFRLQMYTIFFFMAVNWIACGWIIIYPKPDELNITTYFIRSAYWAITTLTTIGYGDITPKNNVGMIYTSFVMITGVGMYGIVIGNITRMMTLHDRYKEQSREKINDLIQFMRHYRIPETLQKAAINHYHHIYSKRLSDNDEKIISDLPHALQQEMQIYMKIKLISSISIFQNCSHECLKEVAMNLEQIYFSPRQTIIKIGDIGEEMFIIAHGTVDIFLENHDRIASLHDGQIFGEVALLKETTRTANVVSESYCDLYKLTKKSFEEIVKKHPVLLSNIERTTHKRSTDKKPS